MLLWRNTRYNRKNTALNSCARLHTCVLVQTPLAPYSAFVTPCRLRSTTTSIKKGSSTGTALSLLGQMQKVRVKCSVLLRYPTAQTKRAVRTSSEKKHTLRWVDSSKVSLAQWDWVKSTPSARHSVLKTQIQRVTLQSSGWSSLRWHSSIWKWTWTSRKTSWNTPFNMS